MRAFEGEVRNDSQGMGHYGASRGSRKHKGIDYLVTPGENVYSHIDGVVTKLGHCYGDDLAWRYIEVKEYNTDIKHRWFYTKPLLGIGADVEAGEVIALAEDISKRYPGMDPHVHYECKKDGIHIDPKFTLVESNT